MPSPLPYFPFYINDWVTSLTVQAMSPSERGLYLECMILQWREGFVPEDPAVLARATGWNIRTIRSLWPVVSAALHRDDDGFIRSSRMSEERVRAALKSASASESVKRRYERSTRASVSVSDSSSSLPESRARLPLDAPAVTRETNPRTGLANSVESEFSALAEGMYQQHPKAKDWPLVPAAMLRALERANGDGELIRYVHGLWCKTEAWRESNARYCPALPKWLDDRGWEQIPDEYDYQYRKWLSERKQKNEQAQSIRNGSGR